MITNKILLKGLRRCRQLKKMLIKHQEYERRLTNKPLDKKLSAVYDCNLKKLYAIIRAHVETGHPNVLILLHLDLIRSFRGKWYKDPYQETLDEAFIREAYHNEPDKFKEEFAKCAQNKLRTMFNTLDTFNILAQHVYDVCYKMHMIYVDSN